MKKEEENVMSKDEEEMKDGMQQLSELPCFGFS